MNQAWINAIVGGSIIATSASLMLLYNGRVVGISGILNGAFSAVRKKNTWRLYFIAGLFSGGLLLNFLSPEVFTDSLPASIFADYCLIVFSGLLVGFGTVLGSGCTSGHGICGISRMSTRSILATAIFVAAGIATVSCLRFFGVVR